MAKRSKFKSMKRQPRPNYLGVEAALTNLVETHEAEKKRPSPLPETEQKETPASPTLPHDKPLGNT